MAHPSPQTKFQPEDVAGRERGGLNIGEFPPTARTSAWDLRMLLAEPRSVLQSLWAEGSGFRLDARNVGKVMRAKSIDVTG